MIGASTSSGASVYFSGMSPIVAIDIARNFGHGSGFGGSQYKPVNA